MTVRRALLAGFVPGLGLCLTGAGWAAKAPGTASAPPATAGSTATYVRAVEAFNREDYTAANAILEKLPESGNQKDRADVLNLQGAILLHQHRYERARAYFSRARVLDPGLWAASFNEAESNFQQKNYGDSRRQFAALLDKTAADGHGEQRALVQYKMHLSGLLSRDEKPARAYLAEHAKDVRPPVPYYFLHAALENRQGHSAEATHWLTQAADAYSPGAERVYAQSFEQLGWPAPRGAGTALALAESNGLVVPLSSAGLQADSITPAGDNRGVALQKLPPATLAVVQLIPGQDPSARIPFKPLPPPTAEKPAFRYNGTVSVPIPEEEPAVQDAPPAMADNLKYEEGMEGGMLIGGRSGPSLLARRKGQAAPSPTAPASSPFAGASPAAGGSVGGGTAGAAASPAASPAAATPMASATPAPTAAAGPPSPAFVQKYEAAYVKFIQKDYAGARALLDEADALQASQASSISLRGQIFKHYYEAAYVAYLKSDYPSAISELNEADGVQANQPDAANLRGLVFSRQHNYEQAENMFKKAIQADATFWAAKFNLAELPFNYRNYTAARARFEELFTQTEPAKQPREAELTQFKVFLTLLLEGKEAGARSFMDHFTYSGTTPARYFCQSALNFYHGEVDKAMGWLDSAKKEYPAQLVSIFIESFYRVGWLTDPAAHPELAGTAATGSVAVGTPAAAATPAAAGSPVSAVAAAGSPAASPATLATPGASASPAIVVVAKTTPVPSPSPAASATPAVLALAKAPTPVPNASPVASATPLVSAIAKSTPVPSASPIASATPVASSVLAAAQALALQGASPSPTAVPTVAAVAKAAPVPTATASAFFAPAAPAASATPATLVVNRATPVPSAFPSATAVAAATPLVFTPAPTPARLAMTTPPGGSVTPAPFPSPTVAKTTPAGTPAVSAFSPVTPVPRVAVATPAPTAFATATPLESGASPEPEADTTMASEESQDGADDFKKYAICGAGLLGLCTPWFLFFQKAKRVKAERRRKRLAGRSQKPLRPDKVEAPR